MSQIKRMLEENEARGFTATRRRVCVNCIGDSALGEVVDDNAETDPCDYCGTVPSAELDLVLEHMLDAVRFEYRPASEESPPWDSAEGGYQAREVDFPDLLFDEMDADFGDGQSQEDIIEALLGYLEPWFERDFYALRPHEQLLYSWDRFALAVQRRRVPVLRPRAAPSEDPDAWVEPEEMLDQIGAQLARLPAAVETIRAGGVLWRARADAQPATARDLGPPPAGALTRAGRMNRPGEILFYGALDRGTAVRETAYKSKAKEVTVGAFIATRPLAFLDLSGAAPKLPSIFDLEGQSGRVTVRFLHEFAAKIALPAADKHPRGYFPTQMVTEYVRSFLPAVIGRAIDGILYPSARSSGINAMLFTGSEGCIDPGAPATPATRLILDPARVSLERTRSLASVPPPSS